MTLIACWVRRNKTIRELVIAADSRVSGGESWDSCPKVLALPRPATVIAMSGETQDSHPFAIHAINTCHLLDGHVVGRTDIKTFANQLARVYEDNRKHVTDLPNGEKQPRIPQMHLLLAGWSWRRMKFEVYAYRFDRDGHVLSSAHGIDGTTKSSLFVGDGADVARKRLIVINRTARAEAQRLAGRGVRLPVQESYDWEPLHVLLKAIDDPAARTVGGAPQVTRIYQSGLTEQFVWADAHGKEWFGGRPILQTERSDRRVMSARQTDSGVHIDFQFSKRSITSASQTAVAVD